MSHRCAIAPCPRSARALCHCCQQDLCLIHLNEHNDLVNQQLNPIVDTLELLRKRLRTINVSKTVDHCRQKLESWRVESHQRIEQFFNQKCEEIDRLINEKLDEEQEELERLERTVQAVLKRQETTFEDIDHLNAAVDHIRREVKNIEDSFLQIQTNPLILDSHLVSIKGFNEPKYDLSILSPVYKIINVPQGSYNVLAAHDRVLLMYQTPNLCLVDRDLSIIKQIPWRHGMIYDMCWSSTLVQFLILSEKHLYLLDDATLTIKQAHPPEKRKWFSCTCSERFLFLSSNRWGSTMTKIDLLLNKGFGRQYESPPLCKEDEYIDSIAYQNKSIAMVIRNKTSRLLRFDLASSESLELFWSLTLDIRWTGDRPFHCSPFLNGDWLIADFEKGRLIHVAREGKIRSTAPCPAVPHCLTLFGTNRLAISTKEGVHFHNLNFERKYTILVV